MKACFLLQRRFAYLGHKLAIILNRKYGINEFCGYVYVRSGYEFLKNQKDINYSGLLLDDDIHNTYVKEQIDLKFLKNLEKELGIPNLWPYIALDRVVMFNQLAREYPYNTPIYTHEEMIKIFQAKARAIISFIDNEKPDFIFLTVIGGIGSRLLYEIAKKRGIKVLIEIETRIGEDSCLLTEDYKNFSGAEQLFNKYLQSGTMSPEIGQAKQFIENFRHEPDTYSYRISPQNKKTGRKKELKWLFSKKIIKSFFWFIKFCLKYATRKRRPDYAEEKPLTFLIDRLKRKTRSLINFHHLYDKINLNEEYAYFPLHFEPEISVLLYAPFWTDQLNLIRQIAQSLPLHFKLYVKEHPHMVGYRTHSYYNELKKIPNVKLVNPDTPSLTLIRNAKLITTISGTAGWEAVLFKKPVITFGDVFYNKLSTVKKCYAIETLPWLIKEQLESFTYDERELENFIGAIMEESIRIDVLKIWERGVTPDIEKEKLTLLADLIAKKLNLNPVNQQTK